MDFRKVQPAVFYWTRQPALGYPFSHCLGTITCEVPTLELGSLWHILASCWVPVCSCYAGYVDNETEDLSMTANDTLRTQLPLPAETRDLSERERSDHRYTTWLFKQVTSYLRRFVVESFWFGYLFSSLGREQIYRDDDKPLYRRGNKILLGIATYNALVFIGAKIYYVLKNQ